MPDPHKVIDVSAGLVFRDGRLLISQRRAQDHLGGLWEFPGGKRHEGESDEDCLRRELREELDIEVTVGALVETITHEYPTKAVCLKFFRCAWLRNEPRAIGCQAFAWVTRDELARYKFPEADQRLLERLVGEEGLWS
jgi:mutator protein MutT